MDKVQEKKLLTYCESMYNLNKFSIRDNLAGIMNPEKRIHYMIELDKMYTNLSELRRLVKVMDDSWFKDRGISKALVESCINSEINYNMGINWTLQVLEGECLNVL